MAKHWGVASFMALALLACLVGTEVEAQGQGLLNLPAKNAGQQAAYHGHGHGHGHYHLHGHHHQHGHHHHHGHRHQHGHLHGHLHHDRPMASDATLTGTVAASGTTTGSGVSNLHGGTVITGTSTGTSYTEVSGSTSGTGSSSLSGSSSLTSTSGDRPIGGQQQQKNPQIPVYPTSCEVSKNTRIPCGRPEITADGCKDINCCFDGQRCYYGKAVTVQCTKDGHFIVVVARDATLPNIDLESISLLGNGQGCAHVDSNSDFAIYYFPVTSCGTVVLEEPGVIVYENKMFSSYEVDTGPRGVITRDSHYELIFQARYIGTAVQTVVVEVLPLSDPPLPVSALGPLRVELRLGNGQCISKGCNEVDVAYTSCYTEADYPVTKVLRDPVYVEVQLIEKTDPNLVLTLGRCWATTSSNPHSLPQWDILRDGCPYRNDNYLSSLVPVGASSGLNFPSHYRRFLFKMFTFVDPNSMQPMREQVYIHCSTAVCTPAAGYSCEPTCYRKRRDVIAVDQTQSEPMVVVSVGPVIMGASPE